MALDGLKLWHSYGIAMALDAKIETKCETNRQLPEDQEEQPADGQVLRLRPSPGCG